MNLMGSSNTKVLVHKDMENVTISENIDIILTPQFYIFLREELSIKFSYQAKQIASSLFDDYLDENRTYQFHVYKCEDFWCFFAYDIEEITLFLEDKGVKSHQISKIFFAQELSLAIENAIDLGNSYALQSLDGIVTMIPKRLMSSDYNYTKIDLDGLSLRNGIGISSSYASFVSLKQTIVLTTLLVLLGVMFFIEGNRIKDSIQSDEAKQKILLKTNKKLSSSRIRKNLLGEYAPIDKRERANRDSIAQISKMLSSGSRLKVLILDNKKISTTIETNSAATIKQIEIRAKDKKFTTKKEGNNQITLERVL